MTKSYLWDLLRKVESDHLPGWLYQPEKWNSVYVDYEPPFVERLWLQLDDEHRLFLHHIAPCREQQALWHPHPWPSIVKVMQGSGYEHGVGYDGTGEGKAPVAMTQVVHGSMTYEMLSPHVWHYVRPLWPSWSIMIIGKPFESPSPGYVRPTKALSPLAEGRKSYMLDFWKRNFMAAPQGW
jgi:hypothetical protein